MTELQHALAVEFKEPELDEENLPEIQDMLSVCAGLVTVDEASGIIRLVHYTTQEYFERTQNVWFSNAESNPIRICVTYLSFHVFDSGFCRTNKEFEERQESNPLYNYAAHYWGHHARSALSPYPEDMEIVGEKAQINELVLDILRREALVSSCSQAMMASQGERGPSQMEGIHLAAYFGLAGLMIPLINSGHSPNRKDTHDRTPLWWAAVNGHEGVVKLLLKNDCADPNFRDNLDYQTPLSWVTKQW
ncbi:hypothetical protein N7475_006779 [Penicillium sp. IBT 31633x]|nr:hypothetical protein N7475_006779 [Penicillium sp. IBT 31633x]